MSGFAPSFCGNGTTSRRFLGALTAVRMILEPCSPPDQKSWSSHTRASVGNVYYEQRLCGVLAHRAHAFQKRLILATFCYMSATFPATYQLRVGYVSCYVSATCRL